ncbi:MAG TPA: ArsI/CadI family heavy metal resistance metalloenzyme [Bacillales bacterium]
MKTHIGLNVTDLQKSIDFYSRLFGEKPVKEKPAYAKFSPSIAELNFTLNAVQRVGGNQVGHFGLQIETPETLLNHKIRIEAAGMNIREEENTVCCYALQDKFWVTDPDGNEWELFYTKDDNPEPGYKNGTCCAV